MANWIEKFLSFDRMMGEDLVRKTYFAGLILIASWTVLTFLSGFAMLFGQFGQGVGRIVTSPIIGLFTLMIWRVLAEPFLLYWQARETIADDSEDGPIQGEVVGGAGAAAAVGGAGMEAFTDAEIVDVQPAEPHSHAVPPQAANDVDEIDNLPDADPPTFADLGDTLEPVEDEDDPATRA